MFVLISLMFLIIRKFNVNDVLNSKWFYLNVTDSDVLNYQYYPLMLVIFFNIVKVAEYQ